jgi:two-component system response regulator AdeR
MTKILLCEDDPTMSLLLTTLLEYEGFEVFGSEDCIDFAELIEIIRQKKPEIVLLDVHLRQLNGFDLLRMIRQEPEIQQPRVLMSSGMDLGMESHVEGADGFILKPYMPEELIHKIQETLGT